MHAALVARRISLRYAVLFAAAALLCLMFARSARSTEPPPMLKVLERTGKQVEAFVQQFSDVKCTEYVTQEKLNKHGKVEYKEESVFDYLLMLQSTGGDVLLDESRLAERDTGHAKNFPLLVTNGFSTLLLVFHPAYQASFEYSWLDDEVMNGRRWNRVHFRHVPGTRSPAALVLRGKEFPLDLEGVAWIDPDSSVIGKMKVGLASSMDDVGLHVFQTEVQYAAVAFAGSTQSFWLPMNATIEVETPRQHWRNNHRFQEYKLFSVTTKSSVPSQP